MARWGRADYEKFRKLQQNIAKLAEATDMEDLCRVLQRARGSSAGPGETGTACRKIPASDRQEGRHPAARLGRGYGQ